MKILLIHNFYNSNWPSGEDLTYLSEKELLEQKGHEVITYERRNDEIKDFGLFQKLAMSRDMKWSPRTYREVKRIVKACRPDLAHVHNMFYLITPSAYDAIKEADVPIVQRLPNFRLFCANGLLFRNGKICEACLKSGPWRCILNGCYRNSRLLTYPISRMLSYHWKHDTWNRKVDIFAAPSSFVKKKYIAAGLRSEKIIVKPNFVACPDNSPIELGNYGLFLGRLSAEKGLSTLLAAWQQVNGFPLILAGEGPIRQKLEAQARRRLLKNVRFPGMQPFDECQKLLAHARFLVLPSEVYETFGKSIIEAYAYGKPVVASNMGGMTELVKDKETGFLFSPGNDAELAARLKILIENPGLSQEMGKNAQKEFQAKYTAQKNYLMLMRMYETAINGSRNSRLQVPFFTKPSIIHST